jgi:formylglycine-generating enzyme required for sulfatase activity
MGAYRIGKYPVTAMEYAAFIADNGYGDERLWSPAGLQWRRANRGVVAPRYWRNHQVNLPNAPVTGVNFFEAEAYCAWLNRRHPGWSFRLPSALEWDRAAHGDGRTFEQAVAVARQQYALAQLLRSPPAEPARGRRARSRARADAERRSIAMVEVGPPAGDAEFQQQVRHIEALIRDVEEQLPPEDQGMDPDGGVGPVGLLAANGLGLHDLFTGLWQWCSTSMTPISATDFELADLAGGPAPDGGTSIVVKGGRRSPGYNSAWLLIGGWFDPLVRSYGLGFRVVCRSSVI